ncbi:MAG: divergent PAP2 family protein [Clostridia bacterium]|nr:divergent PAP2 family protein [Clostridia bacterium]
MLWNDLIGNRVLLAALIAWFVAQTSKLIIYIIKTKSFDRERIYGAGGMPSSHSCLVCSLTVSTAMVEGLRSTFFALAVIFAFVTIYDALGVRRQAGLHAKTLNKYMRVTRQLQDHVQLRDESDEELCEELDDAELKEFIGHSPLEVMVGSLLGIVIAIIVCIW